MVLVIARHAGPTIKGEVTLLITTSWFFIFCSNILGGQALVYLIPRNKIELLTVPAYFWSIIVAIVGFIFLKSSSVIQTQHITSIVALSFLYSLITIHQTILLAKKQITSANTIQIVALVIQAVGIVICFYCWQINSAFAYIYASLVAYSLTFIISWFMIKPIVPFRNFLSGFSFSDLKVSFSYGFLYQMVELLQLFNLRYYYFQLSLQEGSQYLGIYSIGIAVLEAVWVIPRSISTIQYISTSNTETIKLEIDRTIQLVKIGFVASGTMLLLISFIPPSVYVTIFGEGFRYTRHSMRFLFPGILIYNLMLIISSFYLGTGKYKPLIIANLAGFISMVILSYYLLPIYVMTGAGLVATISFTIASLILLFIFTTANKIPISKFMITSKDLNILSKAAGEIYTTYKSKFTSK